MSSFPLDILTHPILVATLLSFVASQLLKCLILLIQGKHYAFQVLYRQYGGMPSTHTAVVMAVTFSIYFLEGASNLFFIAMFWAAITIADVMGVRWFFAPRDKHLKALAKHVKRVDHTKLPEIPEMIGHTFLEVLVGAGIAFLVSYSLIMIL